MKLQEAFEKLNNLNEAVDTPDFEIKGGVLLKYHGNEENVIIPNDIIYIGHGAFSECISLVSIEIPDSVISIGDWAFESCRRLENIKIPNSVASVGEGTFSRCSGLTNITIPDSVTSIGEYAFNRCSGLTSVVIPDSVISIGKNAFYNCDELAMELPIKLIKTTKKSDLISFKTENLSIIKQILKLIYLIINRKTTEANEIIELLEEENIPNYIIKNTLDKILSDNNLLAEISKKV